MSATKILIQAFIHNPPSDNVMDKKGIEYVKKSFENGVADETIIRNLLDLSARYAWTNDSTMFFMDHCVQADFGTEDPILKEMRQTQLFNEFEK